MFELYFWGEWERRGKEEGKKRERRIFEFFFENVKRKGFFGGRGWRGGGSERGEMGKKREEEGKKVVPIPLMWMGFSFFSVVQ